MAESNPYCERLGVPVPRVEDALGRRDAKLFHLMIVALLERGGPMSVEEIGARLETAGAMAPSGDLVLALRKAWHGLQPVYRTHDGRMGLELSSIELESHLWRLKLREPRFRPPDEAPLPDPVLPGDEIPLLANEIAVALRATNLRALSGLRTAAAVLDASARPMTLAEIESFLEAAAGERRPLRVQSPSYWTGRLLRLDAAGRLSIDPATPELRAVRRAVRDVVRAEMRKEAMELRRRAAWKERDAILDAERRQQARAAAAMRRVVLRAVPDPTKPKAMALLDPETRELRSFVGDEVSEVAAALAAYDLVIGLNIRDTLHVLGLDADRWRLADLRPPQKSKRLNRRGRTLHITPELLISGTTGISRPLGDPARTAAYLASGDDQKLRRRLESDVKSLYAFYRYGVLHGCVRLRWGFLNEILPAEWPQPGEPRAFEILQRAKQSGSTVDIVLGSAPGWKDPWSRAVRVEVDQVDYRDATMRAHGDRWAVDLLEVQDLRLVE